MDLRTFLRTDIKASSRFSRAGISTLLILSLACLSSAPLIMPSEYDWISNAISESAAQGLDGAWLARLGFFVYGLAVIWLVVFQYNRWSIGARYLHLCFGVFMVSAAVFSIRSWDVTSSFDPIEDILHSLAATAMGFAYTLGVLIVYLQRPKADYGARIFDLVAATVATVFPALMLIYPEVHGIIQRVMFLISYIWYGKEVFKPGKETWK